MQDVRWSPRGWLCVVPLAFLTPPSAAGGAPLAPPRTALATLLQEQFSCRCALVQPDNRTTRRLTQSPACSTPQMRALQAATRAAAGLRPRGPLRGPCPPFPRPAAGGSARQFVHRSTMLDEVFAAPTTADAVAANVAADAPPPSAPVVVEPAEPEQPQIYPADDDAKRFQLVGARCHALNTCCDIKGDHAAPVVKCWNERASFCLVPSCALVRLRLAMQHWSVDMWRTFYPSRWLESIGDESVPVPGGWPRAAHPVKGGRGGRLLCRGRLGAGRRLIQQRGWARQAQKRCSIARTGGACHGSALQAAPGRCSY